MKLYHIAANNLRRRKGKMIFLVCGLALGISTIVTLLAISENMSRDIEDRLDRFGANIVMTPKSDNLSLSYGGISVGGVSYAVTEFAEADLARIREIENRENLGAVAPKVLGAVQVMGRQVLLMGVDFSVELPLKTWWHLDGRAPASADDLIAGADAAATLDLNLGDILPLGARTFRVAAILQATGGPEDGLIVAELGAAQEVLNKKGVISLVEIAAFCRDCPISDMVLQIAEKFPGARVTALRQAVMAKMQSVELFRTFSYGIAALVVAIGSLLVFVTMMGAVNERTREIGIFRAIGFRRGHVMQIILLEAMVIGLIGGVLGVAAGNLIAWLVLPLVVSKGSFAGINLSLALMAVLLSVSLSLLASLHPARKGSGLDPSEALRAL